MRVQASTKRIHIPLDTRGNCHHVSAMQSLLSHSKHPNWGWHLSSTPTNSSRAWVVLLQTEEEPNMLECSSKQNIPSTQQAGRQLIKLNTPLGVPSAALSGRVKRQNYLLPHLLFDKLDLSSCLQSAPFYVIRDIAACDLLMQKQNTYRTAHRSISA